MYANIIVTIISIIAISLLEWYALSKGIDGKLLTATIAVIAGLGGFSLKSVKEVISKKIKIKK